MKQSYITVDVIGYMTNEFLTAIGLHTDNNLH